MKLINTMFLRKNSYKILFSNFEYTFNEFAHQNLKIKKYLRY